MGRNEDHGEGAGAATEADMMAFAASDRACFEYPGEDQAELRTAFVNGAASSARPSDAELEVDVYTILREPGVLGEDVSAEDIDAKRIADRLAELGWVRS